MEDSELERRRFPIGRQPKAECYDTAAVARGIAELKAFPDHLRRRVEALLRRTWNGPTGRGDGRFGRLSTTWPTATSTAIPVSSWR